MSRDFRSIALVIASLAASLSTYAQTDAAGPSSSLPAAVASDPQDSQRTAAVPPVLNPNLHAPLMPGMQGNQVVSLRVFPILMGKPFKADVHVHRVMTIQRPVLQNGKPTSVEGVIQTEKSIDTQDINSLLARDSLGRVTERATSAAYPARAELMSRLGLPPGLAGISDPVAMVYWQWGLQPNRVQKMQIPATALQATDPPLTRCISQNGQDKTLPNGAIEHFEDLGERTIQNIVVRGCRITTTHPANPRDSGPSQSTLENWVSPELRAIVLSIERGPAVPGDEHAPLNEKTTAYENIVTGEPETSLFSPPADYAVDDLNARRNEAENLGAQLELDAVRGEDIAGPWETGDPIVGNQSQIGIFLRLSVNKAVRFQRGSVAEVGATSVSDWQLNVYQKMGSQYDERRFHQSNSPEPWGTASWDGKRLQVNFNGGQEMPFPIPPKQLPSDGQGMPLPQWHPGAFSNASVALDLTFNSQDHAWTGTYALNGTTKQVRLLRPGVSSNKAPSPFAGTWTRSGVMSPASFHSCMQIAARQDGSLVAWENTGGGIGRTVRRSDIPGGMVRLSPIGTSAENDGQPFIASVQDGKLTLEQGGSISMPLGFGMTYRFTGTLSADGSQIIGEAPKVPNPPSGAIPPETQQPRYIRAPGESCSSEVASTSLSVQ